MAKIHNVLEMWQGSQNLHATQKKSRTENKQMTAIGYISDTVEVVKASWLNIEHAGAAAFQSSERSPAPPSLSAKDLHAGRTEVLNVRRINWIDHHPVETDQDSVLERISYTKHWFDWNGNLDNSNHSEDNWKEDNESDIELANAVKVTESLEQQNVSATPNVAGLI